jgi:phage/plasmid primase-like uncharacterized protein
MSFAGRKPISADAVAKARDASFLSALFGLDLGLKRVTSSELAGPCPRCGGVDRFNINTKKLVWFCRGCDAKGGDAISLIQHARGLGFKEAVEELAGGRQCGCGADARRRRQDQGR